MTAQPVTYTREQLLFTLAHMSGEPVAAHAGAAGVDPAPLVPLVQRCLDEVKPYQRRMFALRMGLDGHERHTIEEVGQELSTDPAIVREALSMTVELLLAKMNAAAADAERLKALAKRPHEGTQGLPQTLSAPRAKSVRD